MKNIKLFLILGLLFNAICLFAQQKDTICLQKIIGLDTLNVYSNNPEHFCNQITRIELLKSNGEKHLIWSIADTTSIEKRNLILDFAYQKDNQKEEVIVFYSSSRKYRIAKFLFDGYKTWKPTTYTLPINQLDVGSNGSELIKTYMVEAFYDGLPEPIIYLINAKGELVEYREGKVVDANTIPYKTKITFRDH